MWTGVSSRSLFLFLVLFHIVFFFPFFFFSSGTRNLIFFCSQFRFDFFEYFFRQKSIVEVVSGISFLCFFFFLFCPFPPFFLNRFFFSSFFYVFSFFSFFFSMCFSFFFFYFFFFFTLFFFFFFFGPFLLPQLFGFLSMTESFIDQQIDNFWSSETHRCSKSSNRGHQSWK